ITQSAGAPQQEFDAVVSYQIPLCEGAPALTETVHLTEAESEVPATYTARGCQGNQNEAAAEPGRACAFTANRLGANEPLWKSAKWVTNLEPDGVSSLTSGKVGFRMVFQTTGWIASGKGTVPAGGAYLVAGGPWAVTAP